MTLTETLSAHKQNKWYKHLQAVCGYGSARMRCVTTDEKLGPVVPWFTASNRSPKRTVEE